MQDVSSKRFDNFKFIVYLNHAQLNKCQSLVGVCHERTGSG